jgi:uncharacterized DUF497 family protein
MRLSVGRRSGKRGRLKAIPDGEVKHSRSAWHRFSFDSATLQAYKKPVGVRVGRGEEREECPCTQVGFRLATLIFDGRVLEKIDDRADYAETRIRAIGAAEREILFIVYTYRGAARRIISVRLAKAKERAQWLSFVNR